MHGGCVETWRHFTAHVGTGNARWGALSGVLMAQDASPSFPESGLQRVTGLVG